MELYGEIVKHKVFGKGQIIAFEKNYITVLFENEKEGRKFTYPSIFQNFLSTDNVSLLRQIEEDIKNAYIVQEKEKNSMPKFDTIPVMSNRNNHRANNTKYNQKDYFDKGNMAFKFNFCDGRNKTTDFGFKRLCSENFIRYNIEKRKADWCSHHLCACKKWYNHKISYQELEDEWERNGICGEARLLKEWIAYAEYSNASEDWRGRTIRNAELGGLCVLTAVKPNMDEESRKIFGVFIIDEIYEGCIEECGYVKAHKDFRIELSIPETNNFNFWDFYKNENTSKCKWGQGAFRYLYDKQSAQILKRLVEIKKGTKDEERAVAMLNYFCKSREISIDKISKPNGAKIVNDRTWHK